MKAIRHLEHWPYVELAQTRPDRSENEEKRDPASLEPTSLLTAGIAHDFNNLLTIIAGNLSMLRQHQSSDPECQEILQEAEEAAQRAAHLARRLLALSRTSAPIKETIDLAEMARRVAQFVLRKSEVHAIFKNTGPVWRVEIDPGQTGQVLDNLLINAREAMNGHGTVVLEFKNLTLTKKRRSRLGGGRHVRLWVTDQGPGIPEDIAERIFDPYFTTKPAGSGLGLATSYAVVRQHGGLLEMEKGRLHGASFILTLPASAPDQLPRVKPVPPSSTAVARPGQTILIVDDEVPVRLSLRKMLLRLGYQVAEAQSAPEAIRWCRKQRRHGRSLQAMILDLSLPGRLPPESLVQAVQVSYPGLPVLICSGYAGNPLLVTPRKYGFADALQKPFGLQELTEKMNLLAAAAYKR